MWNVVSRLLLSGAVLVGCTAETDSGAPAEPSRFTAEELVILASLRPLGSVPADPSSAVADDADAAHFGRWLYFDDRFSDGGTVSCATCHDPAQGFGDGRTISEGISTTNRHAPSILNTAYNRWMYWDGRCDSHWCQALGPIEDPREMGFTRLQVAHLLAADDDLSAAYSVVFAPLPDLSDPARFPPAGRPMADITDPLHIAWDSMTAEDQVTINTIFTNVGKAIAAYERLLIRGNSPFDSFAEAIVTGTGDLDAISDSAKRGLRLFLGEGRCFACHSSPAFTNQEFHNIALPRVSGIDNESLGRATGIGELLANPFNGSGEFSDDPESVMVKLDHLVDSPEQNGQFKTGSLRNLLSTPPYMHGGHFADLTEVVTHYSEMDDKPLTGHREELLYPLYWTDDQIADVVAFLETLEGEPLDASLTVQPDSPVMD